MICSSLKVFYLIYYWPLILAIFRAFFPFSVEDSLVVLGTANGN
jgi:hypothetical protein